jgi:hypothetical protein
MSQNSANFGVAPFICCHDDSYSDTQFILNARFSHAHEQQNSLEKSFLFVKCLLLTRTKLIDTIFRLKMS